jgi:hypothetical protein
MVLVMLFFFFFFLWGCLLLVQLKVSFRFVYENCIIQETVQGYGLRENGFNYTYQEKERMILIMYGVLLLNCSVVCVL